MRVLALLGLAACSFHPGESPSTSDGGPDSSPPIDGRRQDDAPKPPIDAPACFGTGLATVCFDAVPTGTNHITTPMFVNTDDDAQCTKLVRQTGAEELCVIAAGTITIDSIVSAAGTRPLVFVAADALTVGSNGAIDVSSARGGTPGAGASSMLCTAAGAGTADDGSNHAGGGGAGGSFADKGGKGAAGINGAGGAGGTQGNATVPVTVVRGGCAGAAGGKNDNHNGGAAGAGGGAVYLIAGTSISIAGIIDAAGAGGTGGQSAAGGGGAGSGGLIGLDATTITVTGLLMANGGGGGEGGGQMSGQNGFDPNPLVPTIAAPGGQNNTNGGDGGDGAVTTTLTGGDGKTDSLGGGGGGGAAGVIRLFPVQTIQGTVTPSPT